MLARLSLTLACFMEPATVTNRSEIRIKIEEKRLPALLTVHAMLFDAMDPDGAYRRHAADHVAAALRQLYEPVIAEDLPKQHRALLGRLDACDRAARPVGGPK